MGVSNFESLGSMAPYALLWNETSCMPVDYTCNRVNVMLQTEVYQVHGTRYLVHMIPEVYRQSSSRCTGTLTVLSTPVLEYTMLSDLRTHKSRYAHNLILPLKRLHKLLSLIQHLKNKHLHDMMTNMMTMMQLPSKLAEWRLRRMPVDTQRHHMAPRHW